MCEIIERNRNEAKLEGIAQERINSVIRLIKAGATTLSAIKQTGLYTEKELAAISAMV